MVEKNRVGKKKRVSIKVNREVTSDVVKHRAIDSLVKLGLPIGEAKTYVALLLLGESEATPLAGVASVPQPKIYKYLEALEKKGYVTKFEIIGKPNRYKALAYQVVLEDLQSNYHSILQDAVKQFEILDQYSVKQSKQGFIHFVGENAIRNGLREIVRNTKHNIYVFPNPSDIDLLKTTFTENPELKVYSFHGSLPELFMKMNPAMKAFIEGDLKNLLVEKRPTVLLLNVDEDKRIAESSILLLQAIEPYEKLLVHIRHPLAAIYHTSIFFALLDNFKKFGEQLQKGL